MVGGKHPRQRGQHVQRPCGRECGTLEKQKFMWPPTSVPGASQPTPATSTWWHKCQVEPLLCVSVTCNSCVLKTQNCPHRVIEELCSQNHIAGPPCHPSLVTGEGPGKRQLAKFQFLRGRRQPCMNHTQLPPLAHITEKNRDPWASTAPCQALSAFCSWLQLYSRLIHQVNAA